MNGKLENMVDADEDEDDEETMNIKSEILN